MTEQPPPPFKPNHILLLGATGTIGKHITRAILSSSPPLAPHITILTSSSPEKASLLASFSTLASSSSSSSSSSPTPFSSFRIIPQNSSSSSSSPVSSDHHHLSSSILLPIYRGDPAKKIPPVDTLVSCLGRAALASQIEILKLFDEYECEGEGEGGEGSGPELRWFFPSEYGTDVEYDESSKDEEPHQMKLRVRKFAGAGAGAGAAARGGGGGGGGGGEEEEEEKLHLKRTKCTFLVTGPYLEMWVEMRGDEGVCGGFDVGGKKAKLLGDGEGKVGFCSMPDVGKFLAAALRNPEYAMGKQVLKVQTLVTTPNQVLAEFERQTTGGGSKWEDVQYVPLEELRQKEKAAWEKGDGTGYTLRRIWAEGKTLYDTKGGNDNEGLGFGKEGAEGLETLGDVVGRAVKGEGY